MQRETKDRVMTGRQAVRLAAALGCGLLATGAVRAGEIGALELSEESVCTGSTVVATVSGTGACDQVELDWGDGTTTALNAVDLDAGVNVAAPKSWSQAGSYRVEARSGRPGDDLCTGTASRTVEVRRCLVVDPTRRATVSPRIVFVAGVKGERGVEQDRVEPGNSVVIRADFIGEERGEVWIDGTFGPRGLVVEQWDPSPTGLINTNIVARLPSVAAIGPIEGFDLELYLKRADGSRSARHPLRWHEETRLLPPEHVEVVACGSGANENRCNGVVHDGGGCATDWIGLGENLLVNMIYHAIRTNSLSFEGFSFEGDSASPSAGGVHATCWGEPTSDSGVDRYRVAPLKNGWRLASPSDLLVDVPPGEGSAALSSAFPAGADRWDSIRIDWEVSPSDRLGYALLIGIRGPRGFPHW